MPGKKSRYCWEHEVNNAGRLKFQFIFLLLKGRRITLPFGCWTVCWDRQTADWDSGKRICQGKICQNFGRPYVCTTVSLFIFNKKISYGQRVCVFSSQRCLKLFITFNTLAGSLFILNKKTSYGQRVCVFSSQRRLKLLITFNTLAVSLFILNKKTSYGQCVCVFSSRNRLKLLITFNTWTVSLFKWFLKSSSSSNLTNAGQYLCCGASRGKEDWTWENFLLGIFWLQCLDLIQITGEMGWLWCFSQHMGARAKHQALHSSVLRRLGLKKFLDINCTFMKMCMLNVHMFPQVVVVYNSLWHSKHESSK